MSDFDFTRNARERLNSLRRIRDARVNEALQGVELAHRFKVFRLGLDECAECGKAWREHVPETTKPPKAEA